MLSSRAAALQRPGCVSPRAQARRLRRPVRCFQDDTSSPPQQGKATVRFTIPQQTRFGEHVAVVGSFSGWDTQTPVQLEWGEGSVWSGEAELPVGERLEYKYVVLSERSGEVTWQPGGNLVLELGPGGGQTVLVLDDWLGQTHEVRPATAPAAEPAEPTAEPAAQPVELEQPVAMASEPPAEAVALELPKEAAAETADGVLAAAVAGKPEAEPPAEQAAQAPAVLAAEQHPESNVPAEHAPAPAAAQVPAPTPAHPTAADSWRSVLETANQPYVAPQAAEVGAPASGNGNGASPAAAAAEEEPAEAVPASEAVAASKDSTAVGAATQEAAAGVEESGAAASWRSVLQVANQPYVQPQPLAAVAASSEQPKQEVPAAAAERDGKAGAAAAAASALPAAAPAAAVADPAPAPAAQLSSNGSHPAAVAAKPEAAEPAAPKAAPVKLPSMSAAPSRQGAPKGMAPWLRLLLAAAVVVLAIIAFLKSPWAAARWALSAL